MPSAKLTLKGEINRLVSLVLALSRFLNSFKAKALSAVIFCLSKELSTRTLPLFMVFAAGVTPALLQEAQPIINSNNNSGVLRVNLISLKCNLFSPGYSAIRFLLFKRYSLYKNNSYQIAMGFKIHRYKNSTVTSGSHYILPRPINIFTLNLS